MIHVTIAPESLSVTGHAKAAPYGQDIVCAGVSVLVQTFERSAREFTTDKTSASLEEGDAMITWPRAPTKELRVLIDSAVLGLTWLAETYPEYISVTCTR